MRDDDKTFQESVKPWMLDCFGDRIMNDVIERCNRYLEESLELVQSLDYSKEDVYQMVEYVFNRPKGDPPQEIGGVMVTLAALCLAINHDMHKEGLRELVRINNPEVMRKIQLKQMRKPQASPLPGYLLPEEDSDD